MNQALPTPSLIININGSPLIRRFTYKGEDVLFTEAIGYKVLDLFLDKRLFTPNQIDKLVGLPGGGTSTAYNNTVINQWLMREIEKRVPNSGIEVPFTHHDHPTMKYVVSPPHYANGVTGEEIVETFKKNATLPNGIRWANKEDAFKFIRAEIAKREAYHTTLRFGGAPSMPSLPTPPPVVFVPADPKARPMTALADLVQSSPTPGQGQITLSDDKGKVMDIETKPPHKTIGDEARALQNDRTHLGMIRDVLTGSNRGIHELRIEIDNARALGLTELVGVIELRGQVLLLDILNDKLEAKVGAAEKQSKNDLDQIIKHRTTITAQEKELKACGERLTKLKQHNEKLTAEAEQQATKITEQDNWMKVQAGVVEDLGKKAASRNAEITEKEKTINEKNQEIAELKDVQKVIMAGKAAIVAEAGDAVAASGQEADALRVRISELCIYNAKLEHDNDRLRSRSWYKPWTWSN